MTLYNPSGPIADPAVYNELLQIGRVIADLQSRVMRSVRFAIRPGGTPNTNINVSDHSGSTLGYNLPALTDGSNIAASGSGGSYSLNAGGTLISINMTEKVTGILGQNFVIHDINSSSTSELYLPYTAIAAEVLTLGIVKRASGDLVDWLTVIDAGDAVDMQVSFITST